MPTSIEQGSGNFHDAGDKNTYNGAILGDNGAAPETQEKISERRAFRHTKIICTIGPACDTSHTLKRMASAGMNVARLNFSHGDHESHLMAVRRIKSLNQKLNHPISILVDLQGPEIRTGELHNAIELK